MEKLLFGTNLINCFKNGDFALSAETVSTALQHGRRSDVPAPFRALSTSATLSQDMSHLTLEIEEPSPAPLMNHFDHPVIGVDDLSNFGDTNSNSPSHPQKKTKKKDSLPGTQFKKYSLLSTTKPLPGCKAHKSDHYKSNNKCSRESFADLDLYGVADHTERWNILTNIGSTKIEASHKRNAVAISQKVHRILFTLYNYVKTAAARGIYVPYPHLISTNCIMGSEYVSCALPDSIYKKFYNMDVALLEDLRHLFKLNPTIVNLLLQHTSGYQAYHAILIHCCQVYRPAPPRSVLCNFDCEKMSISSYALNIKEYIFECVVAKENNLSLYHQFLRFVEGFPAAARACLLRHAELLFLRDQRFDGLNNIPVQLHPDQWALFAGTTLKRDGIFLRPKSLPSKHLNISAIQKGKRVFECRACGSKDHLWASCPHVSITVMDPVAKKRLLESIPNGNIRVLSSGEDNLLDATNDDKTPIENDAETTSVDDNVAVDDEVVHADEFETDLAEGIITSIDNGYFDDEFDGTIGSEFLDMPSSNAYAAESIPFGDLFPHVDLELGEDILSSVPICQHCRSSGHSLDKCPLICVDSSVTNCSSIDAANIASLQSTVTDASTATLLSFSDDNRSHGFGAALPLTLTVTAEDSFATLDNESALHILHVSRFASLHPTSDLVSSLVHSIGTSPDTLRDSSLNLQDILHPCTPFSFLNALYSGSILRSVYKPHIGMYDESESVSILALKLVKIDKDAASLE